MIIQFVPNRTITELKTHVLSVGRIGRPAKCAVISQKIRAVISKKIYVARRINDRRHIFLFYQARVGTHRVPQFFVSAGHCVTKDVIHQEITKYVGCNKYRAKPDITQKSNTGVRHPQETITWFLTTLKTKNQGSLQSHLSFSTGVSRPNRKRSKQWIKSGDQSPRSRVYFF